MGRQRSCRGGVVLLVFLGMILLGGCYGGDHPCGPVDPPNPSASIHSANHYVWVAPRINPQTAPPLLSGHGGPVNP